MTPGRPRVAARARRPSSGGSPGRGSPLRLLLTAVALGVILLLVVARLLAPAVQDDPAVATYPVNATLEAELVRVVDGDTIIVRLSDGTEERVRYEGIDTPETVKPDAPVEPFGPEATEANTRLLQSGPLRLELDVRQRDRFGRLLAYVFAGDVLVNEALLREGLALRSTYPPNVKYVERFSAAENRARDEGVGIWGD